MKVYERIYSFGALFFTFLILTLLFNIAYQLIQIRKIRNKKYVLEKEISNLEKEIQFYNDENQKLNTLEGIEEYARKKLGMIKKGEKLYKIIGDKDGKKIEE